MVEKKIRVCVIGAGASGLPSIRHAVLHGFEVDCFERQDHIGGLWRYNPEETDEASVMKSTVINSSKELTAYSDFPPQAETANFMHNTHMCSYLEDYANEFELHKYIKLRHSIDSVKRADDYDKTGKWSVAIRDLESGQTRVEVYDGVLVCTGHHTKPFLPEPVEGQNEFQGEQIHAHSYKDFRGYEDKTVVVVGVGNSGGDIAVELSKIAKQVYLVSRRGTWVFNRVSDYGRPVDSFLNARFYTFLREKMPGSESSMQAGLNKRFDHEMFGLKPKHTVFGAHPTINDELPNRIASGTIRIKPAIKNFGKNTVNFTDGTTLDDVDTVIWATGYTIEFPLLEEGKLIQCPNNEVDLYQFIFPHLKHSTLGIIGLIQPYGSIMPISEMQARVVLDVIHGHSTLPSQTERAQHVRDTRDKMEQRYAKTRRHTIQVDYLTYMDELAALIGCTPKSWTSYLLSDPQLAFAALLSPYASYFYRLEGPFKWEGARQAILSIEDRIVQATDPKKKGTTLNALKNAALHELLFLLAFLFTLLYAIFH